MKKKKLRRWIIGLLSSLLLIFLLIQATFLLFGDEILKKSILLAFKQYTQDVFEPDKQPSLDFDNLSLNIFNGNFSVEGLEFSTYLPSEKDKNDYLSLTVPKAEVEGLKLLELYWSQQVSIRLDYINFFEPRIQFVKGDTDASSAKNPQESIRSSTVSLHQLISPYLRSFSFRELNIVDGYFFATRINEKDEIINDFHTENFYLSLYDFLLDSASLQAKDRLFFTKNFEIKLGNYQLLSRDSTFLLRTDTLGYSSSERKIYLKNLETFPLTKDSLNINFRLSIPSVTLTEVLWEEAYFDSLFLARQMLVDKPLIRLSNFYPSDTFKTYPGLNLHKLSVARLYRLMKDKIKGVKVDRLLVDQGKLLLEQISQDTTNLLRINNIDLDFSGVRIDSAANLGDSLYRNFPADTAIIHLKDVRLYLPDQQHYLTIANTRLNTNRQLDYVCDLMVDTIRFSPGYDSLEQLLAQPPQNPLAFDIIIPNIKLKGFQLEALNQYQAAVVDSIQVYNPDIRIANFGELSLGKQATIIDEDLLSSLPREETVKSILYDWSNARLNFYPFIAPGEPSAFLQWLKTSKLHLDSGRLEILRVEQELSEFTIMTRLDSFYTHFKEVNIAPLQEDSSNISLKGRVAVRAEQVDILMKNGEFKVPGEGGAGGTFRVFDARVNTHTQEAYLRKVYYWANPGFPVSTDFWLHQMYIPYVELKNVALHKLYQEQSAQAASFSAWSPRFAFNYRDSGIDRPKISFDFTELYPQFSSYLNQVDVSQISINDADLTIRKVSRDRIDSLFTTRQLTIGLNDFYIDSLTRMSRARPFYADRLALSMEDYRWLFLAENPQNKLRGLAGKSLNYNSYAGQMDANGLEVLVNTDNDPKLDKLALHAHQVMADDLDPYRLIRSKNLHIGRLIVQQPYFGLEERKGRGSFQSKLQDEEKRSLQPNMNDLLSDNLKSIRLRFVHVEKGQLDYRKYAKRDTLNILRLDSIDFLARNIIVDGSDERHLDHVLYADEVDYSLVADKLMFNQPQKQRIEIKKAGLSSRDSKMYLEGIKVLPSQTLIEDLKSSHVQADVGRLSFNGLNLNRAYLYGDLNIQQVLPSEVFLNVYVAKNDTTSTIKKASLSDLVSPFIRNIAVRYMELPRTQLSVYQKRSGKKLFFSSKLYANISGFQLDQQRLEQPATTADRFFYADNVRLKLQDYNYKTEDGLYHMSAKSVNVATAERSIAVNHLTLKPLLNRQQTLNRFEHALAMASFSAPSLRMQGLDIEQLLNQNTWKLKALTIQSPVLDVFKDKRLPHDQNRRPPLHQKMLFGLNQSIDIGKVALVNGNITYSQRTPDNDQDGFVTFEDVNATINNLSNQKKVLRRNETIDVNLSAKVMGEGQLNAQMRFPADTTHMKFTIEATLGPMQLTHFNQMLEPAASIHIKEGNNQQLKFRFSGDELNSSGSMEFRYNDLSVLMIDKEKGQAGFDEKVGSFIANAFVLKAHNPKSVFLRIGNIAYKRDPSRAMFHYWWQSILSGVKSSIGLGKGTEKTKNFIPVDEG